MAVVGASIQVVTGTSGGIKPADVTNLQAPTGTTLAPNPTSSAVTIRWDLPASSSTPIASLKVYLDGVHRASPAVDATTVTLRNLAASTPYVFKVTTVAEDGTESDGASVTVTTAAAPAAATPPADPASATVTVTGNTTATLTWTASPTAGVSYRVYVNDAATPVSLAAGTLTRNITNLPAGTAFSVKLVSYDATSGLESSGLVRTGTTTGTVPVDTSGATWLLARSDDYVNTYGINAKVRYTLQTYNRSIPANKAAVQTYMQGWGGRMYREIWGEPAAAQNAQVDAVKTAYADNGTKYHLTIGKLKNAPGLPVRDFKDQEMRAHVADVVGSRLADLITLFKDDPTLGNGDLGNIIDSIAGPNEVDADSGTFTNYGKFTRFFQEAIWMACREGKVSNSEWTQLATGHYNVTTDHTAFVAKAVSPWGDTRTWPAIFANVPIDVASGRVDLSPTETAEIGGPFISGTSGPRVISQWMDRYNPHQYQGGKAPNPADLLVGIEEQYPYGRGEFPTVGADFTEGGYNHMGFHPNGALTTESRTTQTTSLDGTYKAPPWVISTYYPILFAETLNLPVYAGGGLTVPPVGRPKARFNAFEELDDDDTTATTRAYNIQAYFGQIWTPNVDPTTWVPLAQWYTMRRMSNILRDRADVKVPDNHTPVRLPMTVTNSGGAGSNFQMIELHKRNGETWLMCWRRNLSIFDASRQGTENSVGTGKRVYTLAGAISGPGSFVGGLPPAVTITIQLQHPTGTKQVDRFRPNKARWVHAGTDGYGNDRTRNTLTTAHINDTTSTGHDDATTWAAANPTPDQAIAAAVATNGSFSFNLGHDLELIRIK